MDPVLIRGRARFPVGALLWGLLALLFWFGGRENDIQWQAACFPGLLGLAFLVTTPGRRAYRLGADALEIEWPRPRRVPYADIDRLRLVPTWFTLSRRRSTPKQLHIGHRGNWMIISAGVIPSLPKVLALLLYRVGYSGSRRAGGDLGAYLVAQEEIFGEDRVFAFGAREGKGARGGLRLVLAGAALILSAASWVTTTPEGDGQVALFMLAIPTAIVALILIVCGVARQQAVSSKLAYSGVVIGPAGIALRQGGVVGALKWEELIDVGLVRGGQAEGGSLQLTSSGRSLVLQVEGAKIHILDIYDRPIEALLTLIQLFWRGAVPCPACGADLKAAAGPYCPKCHDPAPPTPASPEVGEGSGSFDLRNSRASRA